MPERDRLLLWYWGRRGGGARYTLELARALGRLGHWDLYLSLSRQSELYEETKALGWPGLDLDTFSGLPSALWRSLGVPRLARRLGDYLERERIGLMLCTMSHPWAGWVARRCRSPARRQVLTLHDALPHPGDRLSWIEWRLRGGLAGTDGLICLSQHVRDQVLERTGYAPERVWVVPHGPFDFAAGAAAPEPAGPPRRLLFFGRILPYKGLELLLRAFALIADAYDLELHIVGQGALDRDTRRLAAQPRVRLTNRWIDEGEVASIFRAADLVVVPYLEASQSGVVAAAQGLGLPVVVTPVGGLQEQVRGGLTGLVAAGLAPQDLADAIAALCRDPELYRRCRDGARRAGAMEPAWDAIAAQVTAALEQVRRLPVRDGAP